MGRFLAIVRMVARRSLGHWRLVVALSAGVVLSSALMSSVFLYSDAMRDLGLKHALQTTAPLQLDLRILVSSTKLAPSEYDPQRQTTDQLLQAYAGSFLRGTVHHGLSGGLYLTPPGQPVSTADDRPRAQIEFHDDLLSHARIVEGRAPAAAAPPASPTQPPHVEVLLGRTAAQNLHVSLGDTFALHSPYRNIAPLSVTVVGFVEANDPAEEYWGGIQTPFLADTTNWPTYLFQMDESVLRQDIGPYLPDLDVSVQTVGMVRAGSINSGNANRAEGLVRGLQSALAEKVPYSRLDSSLPDVIANYRQKLFFTRLPLFVLMLQVVGVVLFYVAIVGSMVVDRQAGEIALLKSRGASTLQVVTVFALEALGISLAAVVLGPLLAIAAIGLLGLTPPFHDLSGGHLLRVPLSGGAIGLAALGALLAFAAVLWPAYRACRYSITHYKQEISRPSRQPTFFRYHLDLAVAVAGAFAFYELRQQNSFATKDLFGGLSVDPVRLATPSLFILFTALVFLRLFPLVLAAVSWLARALRGPTISFALARMVRSPAQHSRLILLLILTTAVGVFAAGFRATLEQGYRDRAAYAAGAQVRLQDIRKPYNVPVAAFNQAVASATGSKDFMPATRLDGYYNIDRFHSVSLSALGVDPSRFAEITDWRGDFASSSLASLMARLALPPVSLRAPPAIPASSRFIGLWASLPVAPSAATLWVRLRGDNGILWDYRLSPETTPVPGAWAFYAADLAKPLNVRGAGGALGGGRQLEAVYLRLSAQQPQIAEQDTAYLDDLQVTAAASLPAGWGTAGLPAATTVEPFDDISRYETITGASAVGSPGQLTAGQANNNRPGPVARLSFQRGPASVGLIGLRRLTDDRPVPVVVDSKFLDETNTKVGDDLSVYLNNQYVSLRIAGTFNLMPSYDPTSTRHLLVADFGLLAAAATRTPSGSDGFFPNEAWLNDSAGSGFTRDSLMARGVQAEVVVDRLQVLAQQSSDPLVAASWEGILFLCFAAVLLLSCLGFVMHAGLSAQARSLEFAVLRTMGMSGRQIIGVVSFEQGFVIAAGVIAGTLLGFPLSELMIDAMGITEQGVAPVPPLVAEVGVDAIVTVYVLLGLVVIATSAVLVRLFSRLAVGRALRMGEL